MEMLKDLQPRFSVQKFHLLKNNCNTFADEVAQLLLGVTIPKGIVNFPQMLLQAQMGQQIAQVLIRMQQNMMINSNPLFSEDSPQTPLQVLVRNEQNPN